MRACLGPGLAAVAACGYFAIGCSEKFSNQSSQAATTPDAAAGGRGTGGTVSAGGSGTGGTGAGGAATGGAVSTEAGVSGAGPGSGGTPQTSPESGPPEPIEIDLQITDDADDATWIGGDDERLAYAADQAFVEVGADAEMGRAGFRFEPSIPPGSVIESAYLRLEHVDGAAAEAETMMVQVFETASMPHFADDHVHTPADHVPEGLWPVLVSGFAVGSKGSTIESPDLSLLVQHVVDRPDWTGSSALGFLLSPDTLTEWVGFADATSGAGPARLRVVYTPPQR